MMNEFHFKNISLLVLSTKLNLLIYVESRSIRMLDKKLSHWILVIIRNIKITFDSSKNFTSFLGR